MSVVTHIASTFARMANWPPSGRQRHALSLSYLLSIDTRDYE